MIVVTGAAGQAGQAVAGQLPGRAPDEAAGP